MPDTPPRAPSLWTCADWERHVKTCAARGRAEFSEPPGLTEGDLWCPACGEVFAMIDSVCIDTKHHPGVCLKPLRYAEAE